MLVLRPSTISKGYRVEGREFPSSGWCHRRRRYLLRILSIRMPTGELVDFGQKLIFGQQSVVAKRASSASLKERTTPFVEGEVHSRQSKLRGSKNADPQVV